PAHILVVDDDATVAEVVGRYLRHEGFTVDTVGDGRVALDRALAAPPDLVVLDLMLPGIDGLEVCRRLRALAPVPIVVLTARGQESDRIVGLDLGADDYVAKPFSPKELVARVRAVLRRTGGGEPAARLVFADLELDEDTHEVFRAGEALPMTPTEFKLLRYLMVNSRRVLSKAQILDHVWEYDFGGDANVVETYISYLRKKVDRVEPRLIHTVRGVGYTLRLPN
ncbi:MAG: response regulator transcription factor, partial [Acidimicrobiia bacterium]